MPTESLSVEAIKLTRAVFESVHGNIGLLRFNIENLTPKNGMNEENSKKWEIICSFFETLGSTAPSRYRVMVNLNDNTVALEKLGALGAQEEKYTITKTE